MKRDLDLIRTLLLRLEDTEVPAGHLTRLGPNELQIDGYSGEEIAYHIQLLKSAGFVRELRSKPLRYGLNYSGLSWEGHEFLDSVRDDAIWRETRKAVRAAGGFTFDFVMDVAKEILKAKVKSVIGIAS
ncbi:DUF2513 domain-containing protein [Agrobacterium larrymoorei]|uniref:DUF2513 domain-containing protein n=1 Tax=Agrobacterium larrymoorei TaxID=160699 RepID=A0AAF0HCQ2_9HYPH|nr:DUF2513 domain-containing protein [Agrobacterium larrymoorei]WHA41916.1 DUF2513 domain-containing protein [Agrobacterium larrymoorei]